MTNGLIYVLNFSNKTHQKQLMLVHVHSLKTSFCEV